MQMKGIDASERQSTGHALRWQINDQPDIQTQCQRQTKDKRFDKAVREMGERERNGGGRQLDSRAKKEEKKGAQTKKSAAVDW